MGALKKVCYIVAALIVLALVMGALVALAGVMAIGGILFTAGIVVLLLAMLIRDWFEHAFRGGKTAKKSP